MSKLIEVITIGTHPCTHPEDGLAVELNRIVKSGTHRLISLTSFSDRFLAVFEVEE